MEVERLYDFRFMIYITLIKGDTVFYKAYIEL